MDPTPSPPLSQDHQGTPAPSPAPTVANSLGAQPQAQQAQQAPDWSKLIDPAGSFQPGWLDHLPAEHRGTLEGSKSIADLAARVVDLRKAVSAKGGNTVRIPGEGATAEDIAAYRTARGVPADVSGYGSLYEGVPEAAQDAELAEGFLAAAHKAGLSPAEVKELGTWFNGLMGSRHEAHQAAIKEWGRAEIAKVVEHYGSQEKASAVARQVLAEAKSYGIEPEEADLLNANAWRFMGDMLTERDALRAQVAALRQPDKATGQGGTKPSTAADLQAQVSAIMADPRYGVDKTWTTAQEENVINPWVRMKRGVA